MTTKSDAVLKDESDCCGGPPIENVQACCAQDEALKRAGEAGCGCSEQSKKPSSVQNCCS